MKRYSYLLVGMIIALIGIGDSRILMASEKIDSEVDFRKVFSHQVAINTQACKLTSPYSTDYVSWVSPPFWKSTYRQHVVFAFVIITQELLDSALDYWQIDRPDLSQAQLKSYRKKLKKMFLKDDLKTVLMLVKATFQEPYEDEWRVEIPDPKTGINLITFDGKQGKVVRNGYISDHILSWNSNILSCLLWVEDLVDEESDPSYTIEVRNVFFHIDDENPETPPYHWVKSTVASFGHVRFETNDVNLLAMIENNVPWNSIEEKYIVPRKNQLADLVGSSVINNLVQAGINFLMKALFKL